MRYKHLFLIITFLFMLCANVQAEDLGYIVKFKTVPEGIDGEIFTEIHVPTGLYLTESENSLSEYEELIEYVEKNERVYLDDPMEEVSLMMLPKDEIYPSQWGVQVINADYIWQHETYGNEIRVAVIDSGCYAHEELKGNLLTGWNFITKTNDVTDNVGHGTHVSGIIAGRMNSTGVVGVAPKAKIVPLKCFDNGVTTTSAMLNSAIFSAIDDFDCKIINMSWGMLSKTALKTAIDYAWSNGAILISSSGKTGDSSKYYPAAYDNVIGVASINMDKTRSSFSNYNEGVNISAPGYRIESTSSKDGYEKMNGTSMAAPHIAGLAALALSADKTITNEEFFELVTDTAEDLGDEGYDVKFGWGLADGCALMNKILNRCDYYVSPVNEQGEESYVLIRNNTEAVLSAVSIFAEFNNGRLEKLLQTPLTLMPQKSIITKISATSPSHFLWSSIKKQIPLAQSR